MLVEVDLGLGIAETNLMHGVLGSGATVMLMGHVPNDTDFHRNQFVDQNQFALLSELVNGMGFIPKETDAFTEDECVPSSDKGGLELAKGGFEALLLQCNSH